MGNNELIVECRNDFTNPLCKTCHFLKFIPWNNPLERNLGLSRKSVFQDICFVLKVKRKESVPNSSILSTVKPRYMYWGMPPMMKSFNLPLYFPSTQLGSLNFPILQMENLSITADEIYNIPKVTQLVGVYLNTS